MSGTAAGGKKLAATIRKTYGPNYWAKIGEKGGKAHHTKPRGFAAMTPEKVSAAGTKGGQISRRRKSE